MDRRRIFVDDDDYAFYTRLLATVTERQGWHVLCYCLMPNHVHLMIETPETNLANGMQWLHGRYARAFNARHARKGHLFETRYKSPVVNDGDQFVTTVAYIVLNPVAAVLCKHATDWRWSSHGALSAGEEPQWIAHARLCDRLSAATDARPESERGHEYSHVTYSELVAGRERALRVERNERVRGHHRVGRPAASSPIAEPVTAMRSRKRKIARRLHSAEAGRRSRTVARAPL